MALGAPNQANRSGQGVATNDGIVAGQIVLAAATETTLEDVMSSIFTGSTMSPFAPYEVRMEGSATGLEIRTKTGVSGYAVQHVPGGGQAHGPATVLYLAQNDSSPKTRILIANTAAGNVTLSVLLLG